MSKPWLRTQTAQSNSGDLLSSMTQQQTGLEATANDPSLAESTALANVNDVKNGITTPTTDVAGTGTTTGTGATTGLGGLGSSYGGYGGMGGMGSMYGGYGGMGGMGMGMGMYGGYGGMGMMNQDSSIFRAMQMMQQLSMVVSGMIQVVGGVEMNANGIAYLWQGFKKLVKNCWNFLGKTWKYIIKKFYRIMETVLQFIGLMKKERTEDQKFFMNQEDKEDYEKLKRIRKKKKILNILMWASGFIILISCVYFYKVGRSFKVQFLDTAAEKVAQNASPADGFGGAVDDFDKLLKQ